MKAIWIYLSHGFAAFFGFVLCSILADDKENDESRAEVRYRLQAEAEAAREFDARESEVGI